MINQMVNLVLLCAILFFTVYIFLHTDLKFSSVPTGHLKTYLIHVGDKIDKDSSTKEA